MDNAISEKCSVVWFKRDLRCDDHVPLELASTRGTVLPLYILEDELWQQPDRSLRQWHFVHSSLCELREQLALLGQSLIVRSGDAVKVLNDLRVQIPYLNLLSHEETGTRWTRTRDQRVSEWCKSVGIHCCEFPSNGVVRGLKSRDNWAALRDQRMREPLCPSPVKIAGVPNLEAGEIPKCPESGLEEKEFAQCATQEGGRTHGLKTLASFLDHRARYYNASISKPGPSIHDCSRLSAHLCYGTLSLREVEQALRARQIALSRSSEDNISYFRRSLASFQSRIAWRCHFTQKLEDHPQIETACMHPAFEGMREPHFDQMRFRAWREGKTGYPLIDACMRSLHQTGWLTFRMRAMLISFASYNLWLDWRPTAHFLAQMFTDYEPGIHYPQVQMQSGVTGINALRMYNPVKQSLELDPDGAFIRRFVPELADVPAPWVHRPWEMPADLERECRCRLGIDYPRPIVELAATTRAARAAIGHIHQAPKFKENARAIYDKLGSRKKAQKPKTYKRGHHPDQLQLDWS